jgi:Spy/CpxP family protein refolding chaperone
MKKQIFSAALSTFFGLGILAAAPQAQDQSNTDQHKASAHRREADPQRQVNMLGKRLNLTADQKNQILPILTDRQQQMKGIHEDTSLSQQDRRAKMQTVREDSDAKMKAVLNDDQKQKYDQMQQQRRERMQQHRQDQNENNSQSH